jgi:hypothetical protein
MHSYPGGSEEEGAREPTDDAALVAVPDVPACVKYAASFHILKGYAAEWVRGEEPAGEPSIPNYRGRSGRKTHAMGDRRWDRRHHPPLSRLRRHRLRVGGGIASGVGLRTAFSANRESGLDPESVGGSEDGRQRSWRIAAVAMSCVAGVLAIMAWLIGRFAFQRGVIVASRCQVGRPA